MGRSLSKSVIDFNNILHVDIVFLFPLKVQHINHFIIYFIKFIYLYGRWYAKVLNLLCLGQIFHFQSMSTQERERVVHKWRHGWKRSKYVVMINNKNTDVGGYKKLCDIIYGRSLTSGHNYLIASDSKIVIKAQQAFNFRNFSGFVFAFFFNVFFIFWNLCILKYFFKL